MSDLLPAPRPEPTPDNDVASAIADLQSLQAKAGELAQTAAEAERRAGGISSVAASASSPHEVRDLAVSARRELESVERQIQRRMKRVEQLVQQQMAQVKRSLEPMREQMSLMSELVHTMDLYLSAANGVTLLRDGQPAPSGEPITVRQLVLAMDEECMAAAAEGGIDAYSVDQFDEWLLARPEHLDQVLPERKGVVALRPRIRTAKEYGNAFESAHKAAANQFMTLLVRNGEKVYVVETEFKVGERLTPGRREFETFFEHTHYDFDRGRDVRAPIEPDSPQYERALKQADHRRRHFMRAALILKGLVDQSTVFHPLPQGGVPFTADGFDRHLVRIVEDAGGLDQPGESFRDWQQRLTGQLTPGMRIVGAFNSQEFNAGRYEGSYGHRPGHRRLTPGHASHPASGELYTIDRRDPDGSMSFRYQRTDTIYSRDEGFREPKTKATCTIKPGDRYVIPFDLAQETDMVRFLHRRSDRAEYLSMFPLISAALAAKRRERQQEQPFRVMLAGIISRDNHVTVEQAAADLDRFDLVVWWKTANRTHRPLVGSEHEQAKAVREIVAEHARRLHAQADAADTARAVSGLLEAHPDALMVARRRDGRMVVLEAQRPGDRAFVRDTVYDKRARRVLRVDEWKLIGTRPARWDVLHESAELDGWDTAASMSALLTGPEEQQLARQLIDSPRVAPGDNTPGGDGALGQPAVVTMLRGRNVLLLYALIDDAPVDRWRHQRDDGLPRLFDWSARWRRDRRRQVVLVRSSEAGGARYASHSDAYTDGRLPWTADRDETVVWADEQVVQRARQALADRVAAEEREDELGRAGVGLAYRARQEWDRRAELAAVRELVAEHGSASRWKGHRRERARDMNFCEHHDYDALLTLGRLIARSGTDTAGMTVRHAVDRAAELGERFAFADDVLCLPFGKQPRSARVTVDELTGDEYAALDALAGEERRPVADYHLARGRHGHVVAACLTRDGTWDLTGDEPLAGEHAGDDDPEIDGLFGEQDGRHATADAPGGEHDGSIAPEPPIEDAEIVD